ncbi:serine--tRNA ligase [Candidatus Ichthyocystis hellenicum]|uniref:serine--tRNA ligase n=1 Tax=Candidatus Ichthyocystis hellenicum TaxID=1561003 RepID=UPI000A9EB145|nr:serine--tRNA ligase [Candidatus Ichthyocystis hellenicum]
MIDIHWLRSNLDEFCSKLKTRGFDFDRSMFESLEERRKEIQSRTQSFQATRNRLSKEIGNCIRQKGNVDELKKQVEEQSDQLRLCEDELGKILENIDNLLLNVPNIPQQSVPLGESENDNVEIRKWGNPRSFNFEIRDHLKIGQIMSGLDFCQSSALSGSRFVVMHGLIAHMHRALAQFMLDIHVNKHGYQEVAVPYIVHERCLFGTGQLPKFSEELFEVYHKENENFYLIPTAEVPVTNLHREQIISESDLPLRYVCYSPCFRSEAGAAGRDTQGMIRQHQFDKVELVQFVSPESSEIMHEELTSHAEKILQLLNLPYRVVSLCRGDLGFSSSKTYDIEVWIPSSNKYREISSCSNFLSFQSRRMNTRYKDDKGKGTVFPHTLNGSALAVGRTLVAIMENYQQEDGSIDIPDALIPYMNSFNKS